MTSHTKIKKRDDRYKTALAIRNNIYKLSHENGLVRMKAREILVEIGPPAVDFLVSFIGHPDKKVRWEAIKAIADIGDPDAAPFLVNALADESNEIRWLAAEGLAEMGAKGVWAVFDALIDEPDSVFLRKGTHHVLSRMSDIYDDPDLKEFHSILDAPDAQLKIVLEGKYYFTKIIKKIRMYES